MGKSKEMEERSVLSVFNSKRPPGTQREEKSDSLAAEKRAAMKCRQRSGLAVKSGIFSVGFSLPNILCSRPPCVLIYAFRISFSQALGQRLLIQLAFQFLPVFIGLQLFFHSSIHTHADFVGFISHPLVVIATFPW